MTVDTDKPFIPQDPPDTFAERLFKLRRHLGWTQRDAAHYCGVNDVSWNYWEHGGLPRNMVEVIAKIAEGSGCDRDWLAYGGNERHNGLADQRVLDAMDLAQLSDERLNGYGDHRPLGRAS